MNLQSKYNYGDTVFVASYKSSTEQTECRDCLGAGVWEVTSPAGEQVIADCPTCSTYYCGTGKLSRLVLVPTVTQMTIGQISYDRSYSGQGDGAMVFKYMCHETGIGSGSVYEEQRDLHETHESAMRSAVLKANEQQTANDLRLEEQRKKELRSLASRGRCKVCSGTGRRAKKT